MYNLLLYRFRSSQTPTTTQWSWLLPTRFEVCGSDGLKTVGEYMVARGEKMRTRTTGPWQRCPVFPEERKLRGDGWGCWLVKKINLPWIFTSYTVSYQTPKRLDRTRWGRGCYFKGGFSWSWTIKRKTTTIDGLQFRILQRPFGHTSDDLS